MQSTPKALRHQIAILGRRNVGKSSLLNAITRQQVSIVSAVAGTTTDLVHKPMELLPLGPVLLIDTAGIDDDGDLGELRVNKTRQVFDRADLAILVVAGEWGAFEDALLEALGRRNTPVVVALNKIDQAPPAAALIERLRTLRIEAVCTRADTGEGVAALRDALVHAASQSVLQSQPILGDLVGPTGLAVLVVPIDKEAPKGRLILPQVQAIRDLLESDAICLVVKERELPAALARLNAPPQLVVTDSQAFLQVAADTPAHVPLTSFSILFSRYRGDLVIQVEGALAIEQLRAGDRILVAEACSHHPIGEDIGRIKIPRWLEQYLGGRLEFTTVQGHDFPEDLSPFRLVILCGACMINRREVLGRIARCQAAGVPVTNYGLSIAYSLGIFERALGPFPEALAVLSTSQATRRTGQVDHD